MINWIKLTTGFENSDSSVINDERTSFNDLFVLFIIKEEVSDAIALIRYLLGIVYNDSRACLTYSSLKISIRLDKIRFSEINNRLISFRNFIQKLTKHFLSWIMCRAENRSRTTTRLCRKRYGRNDVSFIFSEIVMTLISSRSFFVWKHFSWRFVRLNNIIKLHSIAAAIFGASHNV